MGFSKGLCGVKAEPDGRAIDFWLSLLVFQTLLLIKR